jgi:elongation factor P--(R)-beta-lysine ligase
MRRIITARENIINHIKYIELTDVARKFFEIKKYYQILTPALSPVIIAENHLDIFRLNVNDFSDNEPLFLTPHPELYLKRVIGAELPRVYSFAKSFRNSEMITARHNFEFTMLEWYALGDNLLDCMEITRLLIANLCQSIRGKEPWMVNGKIIALDEYETISCKKAFNDYASITEIRNEAMFIDEARGLGYNVEGFSAVEIFSQIYTQEVEPRLGTNGRPTWIHSFPAYMGATSRLEPDTGYADKAELYIGGVELANAATEHTTLSSDALHEYYAEQVEERNRLGLTPIIADSEFADVVVSLPPCAGIGVGWDRLCQLLLGLESIADLQVVRYE